MELKVIKKNGTYRVKRCYLGFFWVTLQAYNPKTKKYEPLKFKTKKGKYGLDAYLRGAFPGANVQMKV